MEAWNLSLDRIQNIEGIDIPYRESDTNWEEYFEDIIGVTRISGRKPEEIKLRFEAATAPYVSTKPLHQTQKPAWLETGELEIRIEVIPNYELESVILSFGENVEVLGPAWLRMKINERIMKMELKRI